jgi:hypothetical protein
MVKRELHAQTKKTCLNLVARRMRAHQNPPRQYAAMDKAHIEELHGTELLIPLAAASPRSARDTRISHIEARTASFLAVIRQAARVTAHNTDEYTSVLSPVATVTNDLRRTVW